MSADHKGGAQLQLHLALPVADADKILGDVDHGVPRVAAEQLHQVDADVQRQGLLAARGDVEGLGDRPGGELHVVDREDVLHAAQESFGLVGIRDVEVEGQIQGHRAGFSRQDRGDFRDVEQRDPLREVHARERDGRDGAVVILAVDQVVGSLGLFGHVAGGQDTDCREEAQQTEFFHAGFLLKGLGLSE